MFDWGVECSLRSHDQDMRLSYEYAMRYATCTCLVSKRPAKLAQAPRINLSILLTRKSRQSNTRPAFARVDVESRRMPHTSNLRAIYED